MRKNINKLFSSTLFTGSMIMIFGLNATNFINYLYHFILGRMLGPTMYGELAALLSFIGMISILPLSLGLVVVKFVSGAKDKKDVTGIIKWFNIRLTILGITLFGIISLISPFLSSFLNISNPLLVIFIAIVLVFSLPALLFRSTLQGLLKFKELVLVNLSENLIKLIVGVVLIFSSFQIFGAIIGLIVAAFIGWFLARGYIDKDLITGEHRVPHLKPMVLFSIPVLIQSFSLTSLYSSDLILVKHFFAAEEAGIYAAISTLGKIIFFGAGPIASVMFPLVTKKHVSGANHIKIFYFSLIGTGLVTALVLLFYGLFPYYAINFLYGSRYLSGIPLLLGYGVFMAFFTLSTSFTNYFISIGRTKVVILPFIAAIAQALIIFVYHSTLSYVIMVSIIISLIMLIGLIAYFLMYLRNNSLAYSGKLKD